MISKRIVIRALVATAIVVAMAGALRENWPAVARTAGQLDPRWLGVAFALCIAYRVANACGWPLVLGALRFHLPVVTGARIWLLSETMRWLPGSVWGFYSRVDQAKKAGVPATAAAMSLPLELLITVAAWTLTAAAGLGGCGFSSDWHPRISGVRLLVAASLALAGPTVLFLLARRFPANRFAKKARVFAGDLRAAWSAGPRVSMLIWAFALYLLLCIVNGLAFCALVRGFTHTPPSMPALIGINAAGWLVGFFAIGSPGGLGARECGMTALLIPLASLDVAIGSVLTWRLLQIAAEVACLAAYLLPHGARSARNRLHPLAQIANF